MAFIHRIINVAIDGINMLVVPNTKFLGIIINQTLTWNDHIVRIKQKISKIFEILSCSLLYSTC
jgi:hypothetical protein